MDHPDKSQPYLLIDYKGKPGVLAKRDFNPDVHTLWVDPKPELPPAAVAPVEAAPKKGSK